jgi:pimeloyl-ACP methyl ester carboxylesterase
MIAAFDAAVHRYLGLDILGRAERVYVEEARQDIPILCLSTTVADGQQYRDMIFDDSVTNCIRVLAFDLPRHGKLSPPEGWQDEERGLVTESDIATIIAVSVALELDRPIVLCCSIGGRTALQLATDQPERFRALIGAQRATLQGLWYHADWLHRPDVHGGEICAALIFGLIAPDGPQADQHETLSHYMQDGPCVFKGDLWFANALTASRTQLWRFFWPVRTPCLKRDT